MSMCKRVGAVLILTALGFAASGSRAQEVDFGIVDELTYQQFLDAVRAAEYVREDYIVGYVPDVCPDSGVFVEVLTPGTKPRVVGVVAATMAMVERNPEVGGTAILEFVNAYDAALQAAVPDDSDLRRPANFLHAVRHVRVRPDPDNPALDHLVGFDTDVGERALELLDIRVPGPDGFQAVQSRMVRHQRATTRDFGNRPEFGMLLVHAFLKQDPNGASVAGELSGLLRGYLYDNGYAPRLGQVRPELCAVNSALDALPQTYTDYLNALATPIDEDVSDGIDNPHQARLVSAIGEALGYSQDILDQVPDLLANEPTIYEGVDLASDQAYVDAVVAALVADLRVASGSRAAVFGNSLIMMQSEYDNLGIASYGRQEMDLGSAVLGVNRTYAHVKSSLRIVGSVAGIIAAVKEGDPGSGISAGTDLGCEIVEVFGTESNGVTLDDVYDQMIQMRQQLADMQVQLNERFDRVEAKLDLIYGSMMDGLDALGDQIGDLQDDVSTLIREVYISHSQLSRMEAALFGVAEDLLLHDFTLSTQQYLGYRIDNVSDLPYDQGSPNFSDGADDMFIFTTNTASGVSFAGSRTVPFTLDQADETVGSAPVARYLNDLVVNTVLFGEPALSSRTVVGPEAWAQGASAYVELARQNPWYFAYAYQQQYQYWQQDPGVNSPPDLHTIINEGQALIDVIEAARSQSLFDALVTNYKLATATLQDAIDARVWELLENNQPVQLTGDANALDLWTTDSEQGIRAWPQVQRIDRWLPEGLNEANELVLPTTGGWHGYMSVVGNDEPLARRSEFRSLLLANLNGGVWREALYSSDGGGTSSIRVFLPLDGTTDSSVSNHEQFRQIYYERFVWNWLGNRWDLSQPSNDSDARKFVGRMWSEMKDDILTGDSVDGNNYVKDTSEGRERLHVTNEVLNGIDTGVLEMDTGGMLYDIRSSYVRPAVALDMITPGNDIYDAMRDLDDAEAILDAYVTLALPGALEYSEVLTSALHSVPGTSELGLRSEDVLLLMNLFTAADDEDTDDWGEWYYDLPSVGDILDTRVDEVHDEIDRALTELPMEASAYLEWMMAETTALRDHGLRLAIDDIVKSDRPVVRTGNLLANDIRQDAAAGEIRPIEVDTAFGPGDSGYIAPSHGTLLQLRRDGGFIYVADSGWTGRDTFTYRVRCDISSNGTGVYAYSLPALVSIRTEGIDGGGTGAGDSEDADHVAFIAP